MSKSEVFWPHFPVFGPEKNSVFRHFSRSVRLYNLQGIDWIISEGEIEEYVHNAYLIPTVTLSLDSVEVISTLSNIYDGAFLCEIFLFFNYFCKQTSSQTFGRVVIATLNLTLNQSIMKICGYVRRLKFFYESIFVQWLSQLQIINWLNIWYADHPSV